MADVAKAVGISRQAVYLHFADRAELFVEVARYADEKRGLDAEVRKQTEAPTALAAIRELARRQARMNPGIWAAARAVDAVRRTDEAAEKAWQDRLQSRLRGARDLARRLEKERQLRPGLDVHAAADLIWTITSLRTWEDLVLERGWSAAKYEEQVSALLIAGLTAEGG